MTDLKSKWLPAVLGGLLLSAAFPKTGFSLLAWIALVPLLISLRGLDGGRAFRVGWIFGLAHYLTLLYWVVFTMRTYGYLPWWQCISLLVLLAAYLAVYRGLFALAVVRLVQRPGHLVILAPVFWVAARISAQLHADRFPLGNRWIFPV